MVDGSTQTLAPTGEPYVTISGSSIDREAYPTALSATEDEAVRLLRVSINRYADGKNGTLYWRVRPETKQLDRNGRPPEHGRWTTYCRLLISDRPVKT